MTALDFLNKNMYRKYPIVDTCNMLFTDGVEFPQDILTSIQLSTKYGVHSLYISKVYITAGFISLTICDYTDDNSVGCFAGKVLTDFSVLPFKANGGYEFISGSVTTGLKSSLLNCLGTHFLDNTALIEDSLIFVFTPPAVTAIRHSGKEVRGRVTTTVSRGMTQTFPTTESLTLTVTELSSIMSNNEFSGDINSCRTPIIKRINTVEPDELGNIDIFGISPISIDVATGELTIGNPLSLIDVCPERNKISPPTNNSDAYYTDILTTESTEWLTWPRFNP